MPSAIMRYFHALRTLFPGPRSRSRSSLPLLLSLFFSSPLHLSFLVCPAANAATTPTTTTSTTIPSTATTTRILGEAQLQRTDNLSTATTFPQPSSDDIAGGTAVRPASDGGSSNPLPSSSPAQEESENGGEDYAKATSSAVPGEIITVPVASGVLLTMVFQTADVLTVCDTVSATGAAGTAADGDHGGGGGGGAAADGLPDGGSGDRGFWGSWEDLEA
ncbi:hypothetical protein F4778DRAFT_786598 [Xylariomycetidae sp. FL2044]|nr:hypothetical protein F4778DRAFT_786598 [Xylariomycetidae sp. FL2044]